MLNQSFDWGVDAQNYGTYFSQQIKFPMKYSEGKLAGLSHSVKKIELQFKRVRFSSWVVDH